MSKNRKNKRPEPGGWVIVDQRVNDKGEIVLDSFDSLKLITFVASNTPCRRALALFNTEQDALRYKTTNPLALLPGHVWGYMHLTPEDLLDYNLHDPKIAEIVRNPYLKGSENHRQTAEALAMEIILWITEKCLGKKKRRVVEAIGADLDLETLRAEWLADLPTNSVIRTTPLAVPGPHPCGR